MDTTTETPAPQLLTMEQVRARLGVSRSTTYALAASGDLPTVRIGRSVRVSERALSAYVSGLEGHVGDRPEGVVRWGRHTGAHG